MLDVKNLTKKYGDKWAVNDLSFHLNQGEILGLLGPNGAGKSTTMNMITGHISSDVGTIHLGEYEIMDQTIEFKRQIGYLPETPPLYLHMVVEEYLRFIYGLKKVKTSSMEGHINEICKEAGIHDIKKRLIKNLSKGYRQRVGIAQALIGNPQLLILDEPTVGLDPVQMIEIRNLIIRLGMKYTVILSSHQLFEVQAICQRVLILNQGHMIADGKKEDLLKNIGEVDRLEIEIEGPREIIEELIKQIPFVIGLAGVSQREANSNIYEIEIVKDQDIRRDLFKILAEKSYPILALKQLDITLEDIFIQLTKESQMERET